MTRRAEAHQLSGIKKAVAGLEAAITRTGRELKMLAEGADTEWMQAWPTLREIGERLEKGWAPLQFELRELQSRHEPRYRSDADSYASRLLDALKAQWHDVVGDATRPILDGLVFVEIDSAKPEVRINTKTAKDMAVGAVVEDVSEVLSRITARTTAPEQFLAALEDAYDDEVRAMGGQPGSQVHVAAVHQRLLLARQSKAFQREPRCETFKEYPIEVFRADLHGALRSDVATRKGRRLRVTSGSDAHGALFMVVPALGRTGYVGRLWFEG